MGRERKWEGGRKTKRDVFVTMVTYPLQFEEKLQLSGHEDWVRDVHFTQEGKCNVSE